MRVANEDLKKFIDAEQAVTRDVVKLGDEIKKTAKLIDANADIDVLQSACEKILTLLTTLESYTAGLKQQYKVAYEKRNAIKAVIKKSAMQEKEECDINPIPAKKRKTGTADTKQENFNKKRKDSDEQTSNGRETEGIPFIGDGRLEKLDMCQSIPRHNLDNNPKLNPEEVTPPPPSPPIIPQC